MCTRSCRNCPLFKLLVFTYIPTVSKTYFHPTAVVDSGATIGEGTQIWHFSHVRESAKIGKNCVLGQNVYVGPNTSLGNNVHVQNNVSIFDCVTLEDDVFCGPSMVFTNVINPRSHVPRKNEFKATLVKKGATIGANATIVCGVTLGEYCFVGAGSVVTKDVLPHALVVGVPAKKIGWVCTCGVTLANASAVLECKECQARYRIDSGCLKSQ